MFNTCNTFDPNSARAPWVLSEFVRVCLSFSGFALVRLSLSEFACCITLQCAADKHTKRIKRFVSDPFRNGSPEHDLFV